MNEKEQARALALIARWFREYRFDIINDEDASVERRRLLLDTERFMKLETPTKPSPRQLSFAGVR